MPNVQTAHVASWTPLTLERASCRQDVTFQWMIASPAAQA
jgi:hypothetical protein